MSSISFQGPSQPLRPTSTSQPSQSPASPSSSPATSPEPAAPSKAPPASATDSSEVQQAPESSFSPGGGLFSPEAKASEPAPSQSESAPDYMSKASGQALPDSHQDAARAAHENLLNVMAARDARNLDKLSENQLFRQMKEAIQGN